MSKIKKFNEFVNEGVAAKVEQMILENAMDFVDQAEITDTDISDFRQRQQEILQRYPSLSSMDKENITNRMNSIIADKTDIVDTKVDVNA